jgi:hypothetical protein
LASIESIATTSAILFASMTLSAGDPAAGFAAGRRGAAFRAVFAAPARFASAEERAARFGFRAFFAGRLFAAPFAGAVFFARPVRTFFRFAFAMFNLSCRKAIGD